ncbi:hypothetical protein Scep_028777 [Stephania cephalantha]|uniref:Uncharacterized protein n=1 Tax=Stephania cephalantha TaxID=152367 RepID=A0AAP0EAL3_9MAGN
MHRQLGMSTSGVQIRIKHNGNKTMMQNAKIHHFRAPPHLHSIVGVLHDRGSASQDHVRNIES